MQQEQQFKIINELIAQKEESVQLKELAVLPFFLLSSIKEDWVNGTLVDKLLFIVVWSPLLHLFSFVFN